MSQPINEAALLAERPTADLARLRSRGLVLGGIGLVGMLLGFLTLDRASFLQSYLIAFIFWTGISMGSMALLMVQYLSGGAWGLFARRVFEASARTFPILAILFLPIAFSLPTLYQWARPEALTDHVIQTKAAYLNPTFFYVRAALYFVVWIGLTFTLTRWSKEQDDNAPRLPGPKDGRMRVLSGPGLVLYMITVTLMSVDWIMSLQPHFTSTIFGILTLGGQGLSTFAFTILVLAALSRFRPVSEIASDENFHDLGKLMLAFVMLWAYFNISQFIIIYQGNLPEEIPWYIDRITGPWAPVGRAGAPRPLRPAVLAAAVAQLEAEGHDARAHRDVRARHARRRPDLDDRSDFPPHRIDAALARLRGRARPRRHLAVRLLP